MDKINKALHGVIRPGGCYHKWQKDYYEDHNGKSIAGYRCINCKEYTRRQHNPNYFTKEGFWDALEWAVKQDWFFMFDCELESTGYIKMIHYTVFAKHLHSFLLAEGIIKGDG